jgi:hypothetical protein
MLFGFFLTVGVAVLSAGLRSFQNSFAQKAGALGILAATFLGVYFITGSWMWGFVGAMSWLFLPWLEILCGLALVVRRLYAGALSILLGLMLVFIAGTLAARARGIDISCGCFGHISKNLSFNWHLVLDFSILAALIVFWFANGMRRATRE